MTIEDIVGYTKEYLRIDVIDSSDDNFIAQSCKAAIGFVASEYRYHIIDDTIEEYTQIMSNSTTPTVWLGHAPVKEGTVSVSTIKGEPVTAGYFFYNGAVRFDEPFTDGTDTLKVTYEVGVDTSPKYFGDIEHIVQLAAYFYRNADKGLDGMSQISTGVKESAKLFKGLPQNITTHFETRQPMRL